MKRITIMEIYILKRVANSLAEFVPVWLVSFIVIYSLASLAEGSFVINGDDILQYMAVSALFSIPLDMVIDNYKAEWLRAEEKRQEEEHESDVADHKSALNDIISEFAFNDVMRETDAS